MATNEFGVYLRRLRDAQGWTQDQAYDASGVPQTTISGLETGAITRTSDANMARLAQAYGVTRAEMYAKAGIIESLDDVLKREPSANDPMWLMVERVRRNSSMMAQLRRAEEINAPEDFEKIIEAVADAWLANLRMGLEIRGIAPVITRPGTDGP